MTIQDVERYSPGSYFYDVGDQLKRHVYDRSLRAFAEGDAARDAITTREGLTARQQAARQCLLTCIGGLPQAELPLHDRVTGVVVGDGFRVENVIFQSRPGSFVTANLYLPDGVSEPTGAVLFLCGHHQDAKHHPEYQSVCQQLVKAGLVVLAQDPIGQGERFSYYEPAMGSCTVTWGTREHDHAGAQCLPLGDAVARYFLHDAMRGLDYLAGRPEVDAARIGVTGNSGGGTQTCLLMLGDPRIAAAAPATFVMNRETYLLAGGAQDAEQIWPGFSAAGFDHEDILLAVAPKPVRVLAVTSDFFPIEGTRRTVARCKRLWSLLGHGDALDLVEDQSSHAYTPALAHAAAAFFSLHLLERELGPEPAHTSPVEPRRLWCTSSGQVRGELPGATFVVDANRERLKALANERRIAGRQARDGRSWLRNRVMAHRRPCELNPRFIHSGSMDDLHVQMAVWWSQDGLLNHGALFRDFRFEDRSLSVTLAVWDGGTSVVRPHLEWLRETCAGGRAALVLDVSGTGALRPRPILHGETEGFYGVLHKLATDLLWLDDDLVSLRTFDVLRALDMIAAWPGLAATGVAAFGHGRHGLYARLAAALDDRIAALCLEGGPSSMADWVGDRHYDSQDIYSVILHGALRHFDLPEL